MVKGVVSTGRTWGSLDICSSHSTVPRRKKAQPESSRGELDLLADTLELELSLKTIPVGAGVVPAPLRQRWFFVTTQSLLHPFFFLRNAPISQMGKLRTRDTPNIPQLGTGGARTGAQTPGPEKDYCLKQG